MLSLPEGQMGEFWEPTEMQCSFGYQGFFFASFTGHVMAEVVSCWPVTTEALV
jgi:hypothetical protein